MIQLRKTAPLGLLVMLFFSASSYAEHPSSFSKAKKMAAKLYANNQSSFYCGCDYQSKPKPNKRSLRLTPDWESCGYTPRKQPKRAARIEWEHVMPAHHFGQHLPCWRKGGRKACAKDPTFRKMESDMHNLVPAIGEVNGDRSNYKFGMIEGERRAYGQCDMEIDFKSRRAEPTSEVRGDIARIYFYMSDRYNIRLSKQQRQIMQAWSKGDRIDKWEADRDLLIKQVQGNANTFVEGGFVEEVLTLKEDR